MTRYRYNFENGTDESLYIIDPTAYIGGEIVADTALAAHGSVSLRANNSDGYQFVQKDLPTGVADVASRFYIYQDEAISSDDNLLRFQSSTTTYANNDRAIEIRLQGTNRLRIVDNSTANIWTASSALSPGNWYRIEVRVQCGTSGNAVVSGAYYLGESTTPIQAFNITNATTTATIISARLGKVTTGQTTPLTGRTWLDDWVVDNAPTGPIGPYSVNNAPVAAAGADQSSVRAFTLVTLNGNGSSDPDSDPLLYQWTQTTGPAVSVSNANSQSPTFIAPAVTSATTLAFQLIVYDGQDSASDSVNVSVLPHEVWRIVNPSGPVLAPIRITEIS